MNIDNLREQLKIDEGVKYEIYLDHLDLPTFGIGHLVLDSDPESGQPVGTAITESRVNECFDKDVEVVLSECRILYPDFDDLPEEVQQIIIENSFSMAEAQLRFVKWRKTNA